METTVQFADECVVASQVYSGLQLISDFDRPLETMFVAPHLLSGNAADGCDTDADDDIQKEDDPFDPGFGGDGIAALEELTDVLSLDPELAPHAEPRAPSDRIPNQSVQYVIPNRMTEKEMKLWKSLFESTQLAGTSKDLKKFSELWNMTVANHHYLIFI